MQLLDFTVTSNETIARDVYRMQLHHKQAVPPAPGQFVNLQVDGHYLRRPISVCDWEDGTLTLIYKTVGQGTQTLAQYLPGQSISVLTNLGNGYTIVSAKKPLLIGGGVGVPPLYYLAKELVKAGQRPVALLGFQSEEDAFYGDEFAAICDTKVIIKDYVTSAMPSNYDAIYSCGPEPMLRAIYDQAHELAPGHMQLSFEARMACGFGACMACSCHTVSGYKRICKDGPVLTREEIVWNEQ